jgi:hypothetical protein
MFVARGIRELGVQKSLREWEYNVVERNTTENPRMRTESVVGRLQSREVSSRGKIRSQPVKT